MQIEIMPWTKAREQAMHVRTAVFVEEQGVPAELEMDDRDAASDHAIAYADDSDRIPIATGRLLPDGHIGRMAVLIEYRRHGVGARVLEALMERATARGLSDVVLNAQLDAQGFYAKAGFKTSSATFIEAGIPHVEMRRALKRRDGTPPTSRL